jgi:large repetitive protein
MKRIKIYQRFLFTLCAFLSLVLSSFGQVLHDASSSGSATGGATVTVSHTTGVAANRLMLIGVSTRNRDITVGAVGDPVSTVTYGSEEAIYLGTEGSNTDAETFLFMILNPASGTANVVVTFTANLGNGNKGIVGVSTFSNVNQSDPLSSFFSAPGNSTSPSITLTSTNALQTVFAVLAVGDEPTTITLNSGQTERWLINTSGHRPIGSGYTMTGAATSTTMSFTLSTSRRWSLSAVAINAILSADLEVLKEVDNEFPFIGQTVTFTVTASNNGPQAAIEVVVNDLLPSGYNYVNSTPSVGSYNPGNGIWDIGTLANAASATLEIEAVVLSSGTYSNTATITGNVIDGTPGNNSATQSITICEAGGQKPLFDN